MLAAVASCLVVIRVVRRSTARAHGGPPSCLDLETTEAAWLSEQLDDELRNLD
jgi:hypothetical protein